jgi:hypothetical protein
LNERTPEAVGAYGLRIEGVSEAVRRLLGPVAPGWETIELRARVARTDEDLSRIRPDRVNVILPVPLGGEIVIERPPLVAEVRRPDRLPRDEELLHPYLAYVAGMTAWWIPRECVHAGAFVVDGGVWGVVGARGAGKSSTLGWLAAEGYEIVCDDLMVIRDGRVTAGPRFVDLRGETAELLGAGTPLGKVGARERWRLEVGPIPPELPLRGWVFLDWSPEIEVKPALPTQRLQTIKNNVALWGNPTDPSGLLELASLPAWQLRRPRDWESFGEAARRLLDAIAP